MNKEIWYGFFTVVPDSILLDSRVTLISVHYHKTDAEEVARRFNYKEVTTEVREVEVSWN